MDSQYGGGNANLDVTPNGQQGCLQACTDNPYVRKCICKTLRDQESRMGHCVVTKRCLAIQQLFVPIQRVLVPILSFPTRSGLGLERKVDLNTGQQGKSVDKVWWSVAKNGPAKNVWR